MLLLFSGRRYAASLLTLATIASACSSSTGGDTGPAAVARVTIAGISGPTDSLTVGDRRALSATAADRNGTTLAGRAVAWSTSDAAIATVDAAGLVNAVAPGQATITAESEGVRAQTAIAVRKRPVANVAVDRIADTLWIGRPHQIRAEARASDGSALVDRSVTWSVADTTVVSVATALDGSVTIRGLTAGATQLVARSEGATTTVALVVIPVPVAKLTFAAPDSIAIGTTAVIQATATAPDGTPVTSDELRGRSVVWQSDRPTILAVTGLADAAGGSPSGFRATARAVAPGNATITASIESGLARQTVTAARPLVARLSFTAGGTLSMATGSSSTIAAVALDANGVPVTGAPLVYAITSGAGVIRLTTTVAPDGTPTARLDALTAGSATVTVSADGQTATLDVRVTGSLPSLRAFPTSIVAAPGAQGRLAVAITDGTGTAVTGQLVTYRSGNPQVATVDAAGTVTMVAPGATTITATSGTLSADIPVTVATAPTSTFHIQVQPVGTVPPAVVAAAEQAARRWERVITTALPTERLDLPVASCDPGTPAIQQAIDGVLVFLKAEAIDGPRNALAYAGPCVLRDAPFGGMPVVGTMTMDLADVDLLTGATGALAIDVLTHELGHVLGIGTLWDGQLPAGNLTRTTSGDARFVGTGAAAAAARLGLAGSTTEGAAIEDLGGLGTAGSHWRERVFLGELMTGWINPAPNPLSIVSVQALRDLGYQVTETGADIVSPATIAGGASFLASVSSVKGPLLNRAGTIAAPMPLGERLIRPKIVVRNGKIVRRLP